MSNAIQLLRGVFVISVVLFHLNETVFPNGFLGVDAFFVISGFLITPMLVRIFISEKNFKITECKNFLKKRFFRLFPALTFTISITCLVVFIFGNILVHKETVQLAIASLLSTSNFFAYRQQGDYFSPNPNPLLHTWSLSAEWQIYLIMLIISLLVSTFVYTRSNRIRIRIHFFTYIVVFSFSIFLFFEENVHKSIFLMSGIEDSGSFFLYYSPLSRLWEFCFGGIVYYVRNSRLDAWFGKIDSLFYTNFISSVLLFFLISPISLGIHKSTISVVVLTSLALLLLPQDLNFDLKGFFSNAFTFLGDRSYSIYLIHLPVIYLFRDNFEAFPTYSVATKSTIYFILLLFIVFLAHIQFSLIENPFRIHSTKSFATNALPLFLNVRVGLLLLSLLTLILPAKLSDNILPKDELLYQGRNPWDWSRNCRIISSDSPCTFGPNKSPKILIIGDSAAAVTSLGLSQIAFEEDMEITVFAHASCPFLLSPVFQEYSPTAFPEAACLNHNREIVNFVLDKAPDYIVYHQRSYLTHFMINNIDVNLQIKEFAKQIVDNLINLVNGEQAKLVIVGIVPEIRVPDNLFELTRIRLNSDRVTENQLARKEELIFSMESKFHQFQYISARNIFCRFSSCSIFSKEGKRLYFDSWHLNEFGSRKISEVLRSSSFSP